MTEMVGEILRMSKEHLGETIGKDLKILDIQEEMLNKDMRN